MIAIHYEDSFKRMLGGAWFHLPVQATIGGVNNCAVRAHRPAFQIVNKLYVQEIGCDARSLVRPGAAAIAGAQDATTRSDRPAKPIILE